MYSMCSARSYWETVKQQLPRIVGISCGLAVVAWLIVQQQGATHELHFSYLISLSEREAAVEYRFDGYYALQATDLFAETLAELIAAPETIAAAFTAADLLPPAGSARQLTHSVTAERKAPQVVHVTIEQPSQREAQQLAEGVRHVVTKQVEMYHNQGVPALRFRVVATEPWSTVTRVDARVVAAATLLAVFVLGVNLVVLRESLRRTT